MISPQPQESAIVFIDGSNWYHAAKRIGVVVSDIDYWNFAHKLAQQHRRVIGVRYYVGQVSGDLTRSRKQKTFIRTLEKQNVQITLGRIEKKKIQPGNNQIQRKLRNFLLSRGHLIKEPSVLNGLQSIISEETYIYTEKRVDVSIAVDMVMKAMNNEFDVAYLVSADGDFIPAVEAVREMGKKIFAATPGTGYELQKAVNSFIPLPREWFSDDVFLHS